MATATRIRYGFLDGNLFDGGERGIDERASAGAYADAMEDALAEAFPGVKIEVVHQNASGSIPCGCRTVAEDADGNNDEAALARIDRIAEEVFASGVWVVESVAN